MVLIPDEPKRRREINERLEFIEKKLSEVTLFPGTLEQYQQLVGYPVEIIDTEVRNKGVQFIGPYGSPKLECLSFGINGKEHLVEQGIEAIINCTTGRANVDSVKIVPQWYGLPVRKKKTNMITEKDIEGLKFYYYFMSRLNRFLS